MYAFHIVWFQNSPGKLIQEDEAGQLSPSARRRSTRASALKAQEKIKHNDGVAAQDENKIVSCFEVVVLYRMGFA